MKNVKVNTIYRNILVGIICIVLALIYNTIFIQPYKEAEIYDFVRIFPEEFILNGMEVDASHDSFVSTNDDPIMIVETEDIFVDDICIYFSKAPEFDWILQVFYAVNDDDEFSENYSVTKKIAAYSTVAEIRIHDNITRLRLDLGNESGRSFSISEVQINPHSNTFTIYNIPRPLLISLIAICIYLIYLLVVNMYKVSLEKSIDMKRTNRAVAINAIIIYVIITGAIILCADDMQKSSFWKVDLVETLYCGMNDLSGETPGYEITGIDPFVVYEIEDGVYNKGIVFFDETTSDDIMLAIYYASSSDDFSEERKVICTKKEGNDYVGFKLPDDYQIRYIRVDYEGNSIVVGDEFHIESVYAVKNTVLTKLHGMLTTQTFLRILCLTVIFTILIFAVYKKESLWEYYYNNTKIRVAVEIMMIFILPSILFWQYISGQSCFVFSDIASDSIGLIYPQLLHVADRVKNGQWAEMFSFMIGLGNKEGSVIPSISNWTALFGRENVACLMGISIFLKVALSGLFMYGLVGLWEIRDEKRLVITLGYEFNAMLTIRSCWTAYPNIAFMIILWLYCFELAYRKRQNKFYLLFAFSSELFFTQFSIYFCCLYGFIFLVYIFCRVLSDGNDIKLALKYGLLNYGLFAFFGMADSLLSSFANAVSSSRVSMNYDNVVNNISNSFKFQWGMLYEAFIRSIGQAISGVSEDFVGFWNVLEGPALYFGIFMMIILPVAYYNLPKKKKTLFTLGLLASFLFFTVTGVRTLVAGFSGSSFKHTSFWITVLGILMILEAFSNIKESGFRKNSLLVFNITAAICFSLIISILLSGKVSRMPQWWLSLIYFLIYVVLINMFYGYNAKELRWIFILVIMTEGTVLSYDALNHRATSTIDKLNNLFYDDTYEAIQETAAEDDSWYRIEKFPVTVSVCESYVQGYYGTASYVGGTLIGDGVLNYYRELGLPNNGEMRVLNGTAGNLYANSLLGVKYIFLNGMGNFRYGTQYITSIGNVDIYENTLALPIGYFYDEVIDINEFERLSYRDRNKVLLEKVLCTTEKFEFDDSVIKEKTNFDGEAIQCKFTSTQKNIDVSEIEGLLSLDIHFLPENEGENEEPAYGFFFWTDSEGKYNYQDFMTTGILEVYADDISYIWFDESITEKIDYVNVYAYDPDEYYAETVSAIQKLQANGMEVTSISDYEINGTIVATSNGVFATSIPYDSNWEIYVDGEKTELLEVNTGFIGTKLTAGNHDIRIYYRHKSWLWSNGFKFVGMGILLILSIYIIVDDMKKRNLGGISKSN